MTGNTAPGRAIGIDLGTTNSVAAYVTDDGKAEVILSQEGGRTVPSVVAYCGGESIVGVLAVREEAFSPESVIRSIKRKMGTKERVLFGETLVSPEEISAKILQKLKADAEAFFGGSVTDAVITVPAYFDNNQRASTKMAGELAGLNVLRIINEPTAAALAYGLGTNKNETVLVYDLGGGTFDVTVMKITDDGVFEVLATAGDTVLGGDDFDSALSALIVSKALPGYFVMRPGMIYPAIARTEPNLVLDSQQEARLRDAAEQAKKDLSFMPLAKISLPNFAHFNGEQVKFQTSITREEFDELLAPILSRASVCVERAVKDSGVGASGINQVVLVGGSTRIPLIERKIFEAVGRRPIRSINPDEAVALGAAVQAAILSGQREADVLLLDVTPLTLGLETLGGVMTPMIARNTTIPVEFTENFTTAQDNQERVDIRVFQGERPQIKDNQFLGEFSLVGLPAVPRGVPQVQVTFLIDRNGILDVKAADKFTGAEQKVTFSGASSLTSEEVAKMLREASESAEADAAFLELSKMRALLTDQLHQIDSLLRDSTDALEQETRDDLEDLKRSIEDARDSEVTNLLESLAQAAAESIKLASAQVYAAAEAVIA